MGSSCIKRPRPNNQRLREEVKEKEVEFESHSSYYDKNFIHMEITYNIFKNIPLIEFLLLLHNHKDFDSQTVDSEKAYSEPISEISFIKFISSKILSHFLLSELNHNSEGTHLYEDYMKKIYIHLLEAVRYIRNDDSIECIKKIDIIPFAILNCFSSNTTKLLLFYNLFINEEGKFEKSRKFDEFIFIMLSTPTFISILSLKELAQIYESLKDDVSDISGILDYSEMKDIRRLLKIFKKNFFKNENTIMNKEEFDSVIVNFTWLFSNQGIRKNLELNNDVKPGV